MKRLRALVQSPLVSELPPPLWLLDDPIGSKRRLCPRGVALPVATDLPLSSQQPNRRRRREATLAHSPRLASLNALILSDNGIGPSGAKALAQSTTLTRLTCLEVSLQKIGKKGLALLRSRYGKAWDETSTRETVEKWLLVKPSGSIPILAAPDADRPRMRLPSNWRETATRIVVN